MGSDIYPEEEVRGFTPVSSLPQIHLLKLKYYYAVTKELWDWDGWNMLNDKASLKSTKSLFSFHLVLYSCYPLFLPGGWTIELNWYDLFSVASCASLSFTRKPGINSTTRIISHFTSRYYFFDNWLFLLFNFKFQLLFQLSSIIADKGFSYSTKDGIFINQKKNHFQVNYLLIGKYFIYRSSPVG